MTLPELDALYLAVRKANKRARDKGGHLSVGTLCREGAGLMEAMRAMADGIERFREEQWRKKFTPQTEATPAENRAALGIRLNPGVKP